MKLFKNLLLLGTLALIMSCGGDGDCTQGDWIGVYTLDQSTEECTSTSTSLSETFTIAAGTSSDSLDVGGFGVAFSGCKVDDSIFGFGITMELDGTSLKVEQAGCKGTYNK